MSSSERLARVHGESILWSSTNFSSTACLNPVGGITLLFLWWQLAWCGWGMGYQWHHNCHILLLLFVCFTWRLFIPLVLVVITAWIFRNLLSRSSTVTPMWWAQNVHTYGWTSPPFSSYAKWGASKNIFCNTHCTHSMLWPMIYILWFKWLGNVALSLMQIPTFLAAHRIVYLSKNASPLASCNG